MIVSLFRSLQMKFVRRARSPLSRGLAPELRRRVRRVRRAARVDYGLVASASASAAAAAIM